MNKIVSAIFALSVVVSVSGCATQSAQPVGDCITVVVDFGALAPGSGSSSKCISGFAETDGKAMALDVLSAANITIDGTEKYGTQIVCRVNGMPSATQPIGIKDHENYVEACKDMPPEFGYWALLIKHSNGDWNWAPKGIAQTQLVFGDSLGLVFANGNNVKFPN